MLEDESGDNARVSADEIVQAALAAGLSYEDAGSLVGVSERTVRRRMAEEGFATAVQRLRGERARQLSAWLLGLGDVAVGVLAGLLQDPSASVQLRAANMILTHGQRVRREVDLVERIAALERRVDGAGGRDGGG